MLTTLDLIGRAYTLAQEHAIAAGAVTRALAPEQAASLSAPRGAAPPMMARGHENAPREAAPRAAAPRDRQAGDRPRWQRGRCWWRVSPALRRG
jgi:hypothetical protein